MRKRPWRTFEVKKLVFTVVIHTLDFLLSMILLPFTVWRWFAERQHLLIILKAIFEVTVELSMWIMLAAVSLLITVASTLDDMYRSKTDPKSRPLKCLRIAPTPDNNNDEDRVSRNASPAPTAKKRKIVKTS